MVSKRDDTVCNFLEGPSRLGEGEHRLIYRHYATLYFIFCVDTSESELGILDLIQVLFILDLSFAIKSLMSTKVNVLFYDVFSVLPFLIARYLWRHWIAALRMFASWT